ncbi:MAG: TRAP transporter large permease subunit [Planctomycetes bacterium]|nr:TRAP transporter large permease subunit [Planctomycetota bacterium]
MKAALAKTAAFWNKTELWAAGVALLLMALIPVAELVLGWFNVGFKGSVSYVQHLTLWVGFLGAMVASREQKHLTLATGIHLLPPLYQRIARVFAAVASVAVAAGLAWASAMFVKSEMTAPTEIADWLPVWIAELILPFSFGVMAIRFIVQAGSWKDRLIAALGLPLAALVGFALEGQAAQLLWPGIGLIVLATLLGAPLFIAMGGSALLLFFSDGTPAASIPVQTYSLMVSPSIPTLPLFTLTGFILAEGGASKRLLRLFRALFGWMPGGLAIVATLVCSFFTTFTGASGVTILALGGLLYPVLVQSGYKERFSMGLLTASGSLGLLFPPSLPVILYAIVAHVAIPDLFRAGAIPGTLLVAAVLGYGALQGIRSKVERQKFSLREAGAALWGSKWEALLPVVALVCIFGGFCTLIQASAITVLYAVIVETLIHRDLHPGRDLPRILTSCATLIGGVFVILGVAMGLTNYLVDAEVPAKAVSFVKARIHSRGMFLLALNGFLLVVGCLMDIYSAIAVVVPLILPVAAAFNVHPLHLGVIFLANLELGYLTPPVGMNLFLSSYRFEKPVLEVARAALPFLLLLMIAVLLITYAPGLTGISAAP